VRALAAVGLRPSELVDALDTYARRHEIGVMTTLVYAELGTGDRRLRFACAGHPPPLIDEPGEPPRFIWEGRSAPINALPEPAPQIEGELELMPGSTVLLYTDGLVEHPGRPADRGMQDLVRIVGNNRGQNLNALIRAITEGLFAPGAADDRSLLGVRLGPEQSG
jgi:serine/threonine-protein kinase RsbW